MRRSDVRESESHIYDVLTYLDFDLDEPPCRGGLSLPLTFGGVYTGYITIPCIYTAAALDLALDLSPSKVQPLPRELLRQFSTGY